MKEVNRKKLMLICISSTLLKYLNYMETNNTNQQPQTDQSQPKTQCSLSPILNQKGNFLILIGVIFLILIVGAVAYYLGTTKNTKQIQSNPQPYQDNTQTSTTSKVTVPPFSAGKIAFLRKDGNIYFAEKDGSVTQLTSDATDQVSKTFSYPIKYRAPIWSPEGDKFSFEQTFNYTDKAHILISDGKTVTSRTDMLGVYWNLPSFWYKNDKITIANQAITTSQLKGIEWFGTNGEDSPYFPSFNKPTGCGGGGRPDWSNKLSWNHYGEMDGVRGTFLYLKSNGEIVYSTGCENETTEKITPDGKISPFDTTRTAPQTFTDIHHINTPQELLLSPDQTTLVGTINGNVVLYGPNGNLVKTLTNSSKSYGPVFSRDGESIFYSDNFGDKPTLMKVSLEGGNPTTLYNSKVVGAISNISSSPDDKQLIFTLIQQDQPTDVNNGVYPEAKEDLYLINADGSNVKLFLNDAYQAAWSPQ